MKLLKNFYRYVIKAFILKVCFITFKIRWRVLNSNNYTVPHTFFPISDVLIGNNTYGDLHIYKYNKNHKIRIGSYCSIGQNTSFVIDADHPLKYVSTYPFKVMSLHLDKYEAISKGDIVIDDDVWIGYGSIILSGIHIGQGAVIAAGSVVTKDIPPYAIVGGIPAKIIKYRFSPEMIEELLKIDYSKVTEEMIKSHIDEMYTELYDIKQLEWIPRKNTKCL